MAELLTVAEVTEWMKAQGSSGDLGNTELVQTYIDAVVPVIENLTAPITESARTFTVSGGGAALVLPVPVVSVTSVVEGEDTLTVDDYTVAAADGILWRGTYPGSASWGSTGSVVVTATVGMATIPGNVKLAALELFKHLWAGRNGPRPAFGTQQGSEQVYAPSGFAVPHKVAELLAATPRLAGFA